MCAGNSEAAIKFPGAEVTGYKVGCWESNLGPPEERPVLFSPEPSLQPLSVINLFVVTSSVTFNIPPYGPVCHLRDSAFIHFNRVWLPTPYSHLNDGVVDYYSQKHRLSFKSFTLGKGGVWSGAMRECRERINVTWLCLKRDESRPLSYGNHWDQESQGVF